MITMMKFVRKSFRQDRKSTGTTMSLRAYLRLTPVDRALASPKLLRISGATK